MKNLNFVEPEAVSKQEILANLKVGTTTTFKGMRSTNAGYSLESIEWLDSITNEITLSSDEADVFYKLLHVIETSTFFYLSEDDYIKRPTPTHNIYKLALLFNSCFFPDVPDDSASFLNRFFCTDLLNDERIKSIPLFFKKISDKETFRPSILTIIKKIKAHCAQNEEFAKAYQAKLAEIRNNNGSLPERLALYIDAYSLDKLLEDNDKNRYVDLICELEQPALEIFREYLNSAAAILTGSYPSFSRKARLSALLLDLSFVSLLQTPDGVQIPRWDEENYLCRLLLDYEIVYHLGILDKLFRDYTTTDVFIIICNHLKWRNDNMLQNQIDHRKEYAKFLQTNLPELFSSDISQKYFDLLYNHFFIDTKCRESFFSSLRLDAMFSPFFRLNRVGKQQLDLVQYVALDFLNWYQTNKIASAIGANNHEQIRDISRLFDNESKNKIEKIDLGTIYLGKDEEGESQWESPLKWFLEGSQPRISSAMKFFESGDHAERWKDILRTSKNDNLFLESLLDSLFKNQKDKSDPPLSLEDFVLKYIPLKIFPYILASFIFQEQNEDVYQNMIKQYPLLSREDVLLDRLSPCFAAIAIKNKDEMLDMLDSTGTKYDPDEPYYPNDVYYLNNWKYSSTVQLFLCVFDQLCKRHEKEHVSIGLIFEITFRKWMYCVPTIHDIIKKYPQVQQLVVEHCYTILKGAWNTLICTPLSSHPIGANIPARIIGIHKGLWYGLKPLLIALRKTRMEWVDASLNINNYCHPNDNSNLVEEIKLYFDFFRESLKLKGLRQDMANGLSDWLKPLPESKRSNLEKRLAEFPETENREGFDITYTEPDPIWRYAYVRAIADLEVDVDGKGHYIHSVMDMVAQEDPSEMVRTAAEKASAKLKKLRNGWGGDDHEKKITLAFWWIKQASRLALNLPVDGKKSLETRSHEGWKKDYYAYDKEEERKRKEGQRKEEKKKQENERERDQWEEKERELKKLMRARLGI
jgi:hypothetical protein